MMWSLGASHGDPRLLQSDYRGTACDRRPWTSRFDLCTTGSMLVFFKRRIFIVLNYTCAPSASGMCTRLKVRLLRSEPLAVVSQPVWELGPRLLQEQRKLFATEPPPPTHTGLVLILFLEKYH